MSFSLYIWHYIILSFCRYVLAPRMSVYFAFAYIAFLIVVSIMSHQFIEKSKTRWLTNPRCGCFVLLPVFVAVNAVSLWIWLHAGVVRDIAELDISQSATVRGLHNLYNSRVLKFRDIPFVGSHDGKKNVLVIGNSWGRDWVNVLLESSVSNRINLSYCTQGSYGNDVIGPRIDAADVIFLAGVYPENLVRPLREFVETGRNSLSKPVYYVGMKWFGDSNGVIYSNRYSDKYFQWVSKVPENIVTSNEKCKEKFGRAYIDMLGIIDKGDYMIPAFSDENKFISQDCTHLTRGGARYYAKKIDVASLLELQK